MLKILSSVPRFGVVLQDSIRATDDCGIPHIAASSLWLSPREVRCSTMALTIEDIFSTSSMSFPIYISIIVDYTISQSIDCIPWNVSSVEFIFI